MTPPPAAPEPGEQPPALPGFSDPTAAPPPYPPTPPSYPPPAGYGAVPAPAAPVPSGTNTFAILSLIFSMCGGGFLGLIFGIVALVQTKRSGQNGRGLAIAGVTISSLVLVVGTIVVIVGIVNGASRDASGHISDSGNVAINRLKVGDCIESVTEGRTSDVPAVPCSQPHHAEVFATFSLSGSSYPGDSEVSSRAEGGCGSKLYGYSPAADDDEDLSLYYFAPSRLDWTAGDKRVVCLAVDEGRLRTGSLKT